MPISLSMCIIHITSETGGKCASVCLSRKIGLVRADKVFVVWLLFGCAEACVLVCNRVMCVRAQLKHVHRGGFSSSLNDGSLACRVMYPLSYGDGKECVPFSGIYVVTFNRGTIKHITYCWFGPPHGGWYSRIVCVSKKCDDAKCLVFARCEQVVLCSRWLWANRQFGV